MTGKTHQVLGMATALSYFVSQSDVKYSPATMGAVLVAAHLTSVLPDIDQPAAQIWAELPFGKTIGKISDPILKHRNITHSAVGFILIGTGLFYLFKLFPDYWGIDRRVLLIASLIAYCSHLVADMFTQEGIPLFFPYKRMIGIPPKPFDGIRIMTGKWFENLVIFPAVNLFFIIFIILNWSKIKMILLR
ncbi:MAG: metal-dependent hydrolase [Candidatus Berkelbacteria bacterium]|nr:metal-dependent hydrolase [Candidatus Berkelbacteria bacterium]